MRIGIAALILAYVLSQFYRAFLAVLTPVLEADLGASRPSLPRPPAMVPGLCADAGARWVRHWTGSGRA